MTGPIGTNATRPYSEHTHHPAVNTTHIVRSVTMLSLSEQLARARISQLESDAAHHRRAARLASARRWQRRADAAARRAASANRRALLLRASAR